MKKVLRTLIDITLKHRSIFVRLMNLLMIFLAMFRSKYSATRLALTLHRICMCISLVRNEQRPFVERVVAMFAVVQFVALLVTSQITHSQKTSVAFRAFVWKIARVRCQMNPQQELPMKLLVANITAKRFGFVFATKMRLHFEISFEFLLTLGRFACDFGRGFESFVYVSNVPLKVGIVHVRFPAFSNRTDKSFD